MLINPRKQSALLPGNRLFGSSEFCNLIYSLLIKLFRFSKVLLPLTRDSLLHHGPESQTPITGELAAADESGLELRHRRFSTRLRLAG